jgi:hypothetical protein
LTRFAGCRERPDDPFVGVECLVGDQHVSLHIWPQMVSANQILSLPASQMKADWIARGVDHGMDLGAQSAARTSDRLVLAGFFSRRHWC